MSFQFVGGVQPESVHIYVVYDGKSGVIAHVHHILTFAGAAEATAREEENRALEVAGQHGARLQGLKVLGVDAYDAAKPMTVDVRKKRLIEATPEKAKTAAKKRKKKK